MHRVLLVATVVVLAALPLHAGGRTQLVSEGWGSLTGRITLPGQQKPKGVQYVVVWIKPPAKEFFAIHPKYKKRTDTLVIEIPNNFDFDPPVSALNPIYFDGKKDVETGQKLVIKNSSNGNQNSRATSLSGGFNINLPAGVSADVTKNVEPQKLPYNLQNDFYPMMRAKFLVFDHPYFAITNKDGYYEIPIAPAGANVFLMFWQEDRGYLLPEKSKGRAIKLKQGRNTFDLEVK